MTIYTTTEERTFEASTDKDDIAIAGRMAADKLEELAKADGFDHRVEESFKITIRRTANEKIGLYRAEASATYARIVPAIGHRSPVAVSLVDESELS